LIIVPQLHGTGTGRAIAADERMGLLAVRDAFQPEQAQVLEAVPGVQALERRVQVGEQRRQRPKIFGRKPLPQPLALNRAFNEERVDQHEAVLEDLQRQGDDFLLFSAIRGQFALTTIADEVIGRVPVLNDVESLVDLPLNLSRSKVIAEKDRLFGLPNFGNSGFTIPSAFSGDCGLAARLPDYWKA
jgi:hypothetical protein